jgi:ribosomal protein S18 acetylase RimI-like enzyme
MTDAIDGTWRPMRPDDLPAVLALSRLVHPHHPERLEIFAERLDLFPDGCLVLDGFTSSGGYLVSHPWQGGRPIPLDTRLGALPPSPDRFHLHDLALHSRMRGRGAGRSAVAHAAAIAQEHALSRLSLVALPDSHGFWRRLSFHDEDAVPLAAGYGDGARFMSRDTLVPDPV